MSLRMMSLSLLQVALDLSLYYVLLPQSFGFHTRVFLVGIILISFGFNSLYSFKNVTLISEIKSFVKALALSVIFDTLFIFSSALNVGIYEFIVSLVVFSILDFIVRYLLRTSGFLKLSVLAIGESEAVKNLIDKISSSKFAARRVIKFSSDNRDLKNTLQNIRPDEALISVSDFSKDDLRKITAVLEKHVNQIFFVSENYDVLNDFTSAQNFDGLIIISSPKRKNIFNFLSAVPAYAFEGPGDIINTSLRKDYRYDMRSIYKNKSVIYKFFKRMFDIISSGCALVVLSPLFLVTAIAIKIEDGGPIFFSAKRYGKDMKFFNMLKFRSMVPDAESAKLKDLLKDNEMTGHTFKIKNDPRITKVGKFIRRFSIDELPQLWNVFTGDMSVVGPRPIMTLNMDTCDDYDRQRWIVQPGLTCYWQVSGRADVKWEQWVEMDLDYIEDMNFWLDLKLIFKTIPAVFKGEGAY